MLHCQEEEAREKRQRYIKRGGRRGWRGKNDSQATVTEDTR